MLTVQKGVGIYSNWNSRSYPKGHLLMCLTVDGSELNDRQLLVCVGVGSDGIHTEYLNLVLLQS